MSRGRMPQGSFAGVTERAIVGGCVNLAFSLAVLVGLYFLGRNVAAHVRAAARSSELCCSAASSRAYRPQLGQAARPAAIRTCGIHIAELSWDGSPPHPR